MTGLATADPGSVPPGLDPGTPTPRTVVITNAGDDVAVTAHLAALGTFGDARIVVRPTPGADDVRTLGLDVLVATGKNPTAAQQERVTAGSWEIARAWMTGQRVTDVIVDRAHRLSMNQAGALGERYRPTSVAVVGVGQR
ncbi:MAG: hypothetical protein ACRDU4_01695 [Mycobacterium sp.]